MPGFSEGAARFIDDSNATAVNATAALLGGRALLGLAPLGPRPEDVDAHELIRRGIPAMALDHLLEGLTVLERGQLLDGALGMSVRTLQRYRETPDKPLNREQSDRVWSFAEILAQAIAVFGDREEAERWLASPSIGLEQRRPLDLLATSVGTTRVTTLLTQIEFGVYT